MVLVNGLEAWVEWGRKAEALSTQVYEPGVVHPDGHDRLRTFVAEPWPTWAFALGDGSGVRHEVFVPRGLPACACSWSLTPPARAGTASSTRVSPVLCVRPLMSGRNYHHTHHENGVFNTMPEVRKLEGGACVRFSPYHGVPTVSFRTNGVFAHDPVWYRQFRYDAELARGLDHLEDLMSPGVFRFELGSGREAVLLMHASTPGHEAAPEESPAVVLDSWRAGERRRRGEAATPVGALRRSADSYLVRRGLSTTIIAGYPWFTDWGRDTFISVRGLCLATGKLEEARRILTDWARYRSGGMMPNRFPDEGAAPEFHSVDAGLWYVIAGHEFVRAAREGGFRLARGDERAILDTARGIVEGCIEGTRLGIVCDPVDGLLRAGEEGTALTWMDARYDGHAVTPRVGKPVEIQALWINALAMTAGKDRALVRLLARARESFPERFWIEQTGYLADVIDVNHAPGHVDRSIRPNAMLAVGGLAECLLDAERARRAVDLAASTLWTPMGMRTLAPSDPAYKRHYHGGRVERDEAYHQGTAWPWLIGPFVEAWVRSRGSTIEAKREAWRRFVQPMLEFPGHGAMGHLFEVADGDEPHAPGGCPAQAWSVAEVIRLAKLLEIAE